METRRKFIKGLSVVSGIAVLAGSGMLSSCRFLKEKRSQLFESDIPLLDEIGETIIPSSKESPGAKTAEIGKFMVMMVNECYSVTQYHAFLHGLDDFEKKCDQQFNREFPELNPEERKLFLSDLLAISKKHQKNYVSSQPPAFVDMVKDLTVTGYFSSFIGVTKARRYEAIPGKFLNCIPYHKGDKPWATS